VAHLFVVFCCCWFLPVGSLTVLVYCALPACFINCQVSYGIGQVPCDLGQVPRDTGHEPPHTHVVVVVAVAVAVLVGVVAVLVGVVAVAAVVVVVAVAVPVPQGGRNCTAGPTKRKQTRRRAPEHD
jgi:hypothetical protein